MALVLAACASGGPLGVPATGAKGLAAQPLVSYSDLFASPARYVGKPVRVVGIYLIGFEWEELYSTRCPDAHTTWVEGSGAYCADVPQPKARRSGSAEEPPETSGATLGMIARSTLTGGDGSGYGHLNAYNFQFNLACIEDLEFLDARSYHVHALTHDMGREIERFLVRVDAATARPQ